ncbi:sulfotransferase 2A1-like [Lethenteron reissneri]|uniref:sulfotransferase 2A1-like n=1 Tax=Lethenteron reissneri TaxID=7753 RepID=UPI002AB7CCD3|nr:sulfotransferase 2A1-like [Lethenteron reissneri]XP_061427957.1 sulfotransferase 2A1-like [Lethenteron reissneri]
MAGQQEQQDQQQEQQHNGVAETQHESPRTAMFAYSGILFPSNIHSAETLGYAREFPVRSYDLFVVTYPKSGTTWMQEIVTLLYSDGDLGPVQSVPNWERVPWLEQDTGRKHLEHRASPRLITTHLPFQLAPREIGQAKAKVIYMARNPRDILVSSYNFHKIARFLEEPGTWEEFYDKFCEGKVLFGSWFEHVRGWLENRDKVDLFFVSYEDLHRDLEGVVRRLCRFVGREASDRLTEVVASHCRFSSMRESRMVNYSLVPEQWIDHKRGSFMRKGVVGDWKTQFTVAQSEHFDELYEERMRGVTMSTSSETLEP